MALTAAEKRARRAQAATEQRKAEADRGKRRRAQQREVTKQHDRDRRQRRRKEIMAAALEDDDDANASLDLAAARAHWHRLRKAHTAEVDEQAQAAMQADRARKADATREARYEKAEVKRVERLSKQRKKAVRIASAQVKYEERRRNASEAKMKCDELRKQMRMSDPRRPDALQAWPAACGEHLKAADAKACAGYKMRRLSKAPPHMVREARDGAAWATELQVASLNGSCSRVLPSLASQARRLVPVRRAEALKGERGKGGIEYATYYNRAIETQTIVPVGRKSAPATKAEIDFMKFREPSAWQRAEEALFDSDWHCDVAAPGCLRPAGEAAEPARPYNLWSCTECKDGFVMCGACHETSVASRGHTHPHRLRLYRYMPLV